MVHTPQDNLIRIGVIYDGNYFHHVSNYYYYVHERRSRISISGLHDFIRYQIAQEEGRDVRHCHIVDAHYFRGRFSAKDAYLKGNQLYYDRVFEDILMLEGVTTHYLPVKSVQGYKQEKGIDVWLALEAFELAFYKKYSILVLIASDGDYVPLARKLNSIGTKVMVLSWDFEYTDDFGQQRTTRTSQELLEEVSYPHAMHEIIDNRLRKNEPLINNLFVPRSEAVREKVFSKFDSEDKELMTGTILSVKNGYGFIKYPPNNLFFHYANVIDFDFNLIEPGDQVQFRIEKNTRGEDTAVDVRVVE